MCRTVSSDCHRMNLVEPLFIQGMFLLSRHVLLHTCSLLALLYFTVRLLYTVDSHLGTAQCSHTVPLSGAEKLHLGTLVSNVLLKSTPAAVSAARSLIRSLTGFSQLV